MNLPLCPFCQQTVTKPLIDSIKYRCYSCNTKKTVSFAKYPFFVCGVDDYEDIIDYKINTLIDNEIYGFDSYKKSKITEILKFENPDNGGKGFDVFMSFDFFIPLPKDEQSINNIICRLINLKAFL